MHRWCRIPSRWSKLQKEFYKILAEGLDLQLHCRVYRMQSQRGSTGLPRYWITLGKQTIWDYPGTFIKQVHPERARPDWYPYLTDISAISALIKEYLDTPREDLLNKAFVNDHWGLVNILRAADRRIGVWRLEELKKGASDESAQRVIEARLGRPVFVAYPAAFDFMFVYWYLIRFTGESPFSHSALDIKTYAMVLLHKPYRESTKKNMPVHWFDPLPHTHQALDDAMEQGALFCNMLAEAETLHGGNETMGKVSGGREGQ